MLENHCNSEKSEKSSCLRVSSYYLVMVIISGLNGISSIAVFEHLVSGRKTFQIHMY